MSSTRIIRKYPNRRLYDCEESRYITLCDIRTLVRNKIDFVVIERKNGADITRSVLLQVISDREDSGDPLLSRTLLCQLINAYDEAQPGLLTDWLEQSMSLYLGQQEPAAAFRKRAADA